MSLSDDSVDAVCDGGVEGGVDLSASSELGDAGGDSTGGGTFRASTLHSVASISPFDAQTGIDVPSGAAFGNSALRDAPQFLPHSLNGSTYPGAAF